MTPRTMLLNKQNIDLFCSLFRGRDGVVYALHWTNPLTGKSGYKPVYGEQENTLALTDEVLTAHLRGDDLIGAH